MAINLKALKKLQADLREVPPNESEERNLSALEAVSMVTDEVQQLRAKGYSFGRIAELLTAGGLSIKEGTLKQYLQKLNRNAKAKKPASVLRSKSAPKENTIDTSPVALPRTLKKSVPRPPANKESGSDRRPAAPVKEQKPETPGSNPIAPGSFAVREDSTDI